MGACVGRPMDTATIAPEVTVDPKTGEYTFKAQRRSNDSIVSKIPRPLTPAADLTLRGRYRIASFDRTVKSVQLAWDSATRQRVALKFVTDIGRGQWEVDMLRMVGPAWAPAVLDSFFLDFLPGAGAPPDAGSREGGLPWAAPNAPSLPATAGGENARGKSKGGTWGQTLRLRSSRTKVRARPARRPAPRRPRHAPMHPPRGHCAWPPTAVLPRAGAPLHALPRPLPGRCQGVRWRRCRRRRRIGPAAPQRRGGGLRGRRGAGLLLLRDGGRRQPGDTGRRLPRQPPRPRQQQRLARQRQRAVGGADRARHRHACGAVREAAA